MTLFKWLLTLVITMSACTTHAQTVLDPFKGNWTKGQPDRFKGDVWVEYFINDTVCDFLSSRVLFEPSARSIWHKHSGRQIVFAVYGDGFLKEKGKPITLLKKGDVVIIEPGTVHCHGSIGKRFMQGVMMNDVGRKETTTWLDQVADQELYQ